MPAAGRGVEARPRGWLVLAVAAVVAALPAPTVAELPVRKPGLGESWYPTSRVLCTAVAHYLLRSVSGAPRAPGRPLGLVLPHAGWAFSGAAAAAPLRDLRPGDFDRVVVLAPLHAGGFAGFAAEDVSAYRTPLGDVPLCGEAMAALRLKGARRPEGSAAGREHAVEVLLPLLQAALGRFCLVPLLLGAPDAAAEDALAGALAGFDDGRTLFVASSDFVHYGERYAYTPFGPTPGEAGERLRAFDDRAVALVAAGDPGPLRAFFEETGHNACGRQPLLVLLELLRRRAPGAAATLVARYASSDLPFLREATSVGYASLAFTRERADEPVPPLGVLPTLKAATAEDWRVGDELGAGLARLARATLETDYFGGDALARALRDLAEARPLARRQAVFVSLYREGPPGAKAQERLRGCRGQGEPVLPLDLAVVQAALEAATRDERFPRVRAEELGRLQVEVTVLSPLREVDSHEAYRFGQDGLALIQGKKGALFLPQVWREAGWSSEEALQELSRKAGLPHDAWRRARLIAFEGQAFAEERIASGLP